jgi:hypothetical protein
LPGRSEPDLVAFPDVCREIARRGEDHEQRREKAADAFAFVPGNGLDIGIEAVERAALGAGGFEGEPAEVVTQLSHGRSSPGSGTIPTGPGRDKVRRWSAGWQFAGLSLAVGCHAEVLRRSGGLG